jgi:hypothetical protein
MSGIYLSYRRRESAGYAGRLFDHLSRHFGPGSVFMDIGGIARGQDFAQAIESALNACEVVLVLIGNTWASCTGQDGRRRLDDPRDWVRLEVAAALRRDSLVVPVLIDGARLPDPAGLPEELRPLCQRNACELSDLRWTYDVGELVKDVEKMVRPPKRSKLSLMKDKRLHWRAWSLIILALLGMVFVGLTFLRKASVEPSKVMPSERRTSEKKPQIRLRSEKSTLSVDQAKVMISAHNFYRTSWNDSGTGIEHGYETQALNGALVVVDHATGLMWQKGGSDDGVGLPEAERYAGDLNAKTWAGFSDWRLPTLEEAMSLMTTDKDGMPDEVMVGDERVKGMVHLNPIFGRSNGPFIWTSDSYSPGRGWVVYFCDAKCVPEDLDFNAYVRAVRSSTNK